jgi:PAS domain S-box-containing protein
MCVGEWQPTMVTERRRAEEALAASEMDYRELFENASDAISTYDLEGRTLSSNRAAERLSGYSREEGLQMTFFQVIPPEYHAALRQALKHLKAGKLPPTLEVEILTKDGRRVPVEASTRPILRGGKLVALEVVARDITQRQQALAEIAKKNHLAALAEYHEALERALKRLQTGAGGNK